MESKKKRMAFNIYKRICSMISIKRMALIAVIVFIILMLPICSLSFVNRASGDDYGYGTFTREAWVTSHSLVQVAKAACRTIEHYYSGWQGTWFSIFMFSLQPEVFSEKAYVLTAFFMLFLWIGSTVLLLKQILHKSMRLDKWSSFLTIVLYLIISIQFIPSTKSSIFWFNGAVHYMLPFTMCQFLIYLMINYVREYNAGCFLGIVLIMTLLGGSNYQAALFALIAAVYAGAADYIDKKDKRILRLIIPIIFEMTGLIISMKAPGNKVRGGEEFGFSLSAGIKTIGLSFVEGLKAFCSYFREKPLIFVGLFLLFLILAEAFKKRKRDEEPDNFIVFKYPLFVSLALFCLYSVMQAPAIYAGVEVSGGVYNMNFLTFLLAISCILMIIAKKAADKSKYAETEFHKKAVVPGLLVCMVLIVICRGNIKISTSWICFQYIVSGQAADYKEQMDLQTELLLDENVTDAVLPFINDVQGPLMHMPVTDNQEAWTNTVTRDFYGKNSVVAMPRDEWLKTYGINTKY